MAYVGNIPAEAYISLSSQTFTTINGTGYTLSSEVTNSEDIALFLNDVRQKPSTYTATGTTLTMGTATTTLDTLYCVYLGKGIQTVNPPAASVNTAEIADGAVTNAKVDASAAVAYSKLNLTDSIVNADINSSAAIATSKITGLAASATTDTTDASNIGSGTLPDGRFPATLPTASGANLTNLNATNLATGSVATARLASTGTASATTFLRGDQAWAEAGGGSYELLTSTTASDVASFAINGFFSGDYDIYKIFMYNVYAGSNDQDIRLRVNTGGSYTDQTAQEYFYCFNRIDGTTSDTNNSEQAAQYQTANIGMMVGRISSTSNKMSNTEITLYKPSDSSNFFQVTAVFGGWNDANEICTGTSTGIYTQTTAITGVTLLSQSGNIWCEKAYLYGIKNS